MLASALSLISTDQECTRYFTTLVSILPTLLLSRPPVQCTPSHSIFRFVRVQRLDPFFVGLLPTFTTLIFASAYYQT